MIRPHRRRTPAFDQERAYQIYLPPPESGFLRSSVNIARCASVLRADEILITARQLSVVA
jgi:hypothetical protein